MVGFSTEQPSNPPYGTTSQPYYLCSSSDLIRTATGPSPALQTPFHAPSLSLSCSSGLDWESS